MKFKKHVVNQKSYSNIRYMCTKIGIELDWRTPNENQFVTNENS